MRLERRRRSGWIGVTFWCRSRVRASRTGFAAAMADATPFLPGLSPVWTKSLTAAQDAGNLTSNGGLVVLREAARRLDLAAVIADPLPDTRNPLLRHPLLSRDGDGAHDGDRRRLRGCRRPRRAAPRSRAADRLRACAGERPRHSEPADHLAPGEPRRHPDAVPDRHRLHRSVLPQLRPRRRPRSCSTSTTPTTWCTASRSWRCSTPTRAATASSRSTSSRASGKPILSLLRPGKRPSGEESGIMPPSTL